jgi:hypothetical protein
MCRQKRQETLTPVAAKGLDDESATRQSSRAVAVERRLDFVSHGHGAVPARGNPSRRWRCGIAVFALTEKLPDWKAKGSFIIEFSSFFAISLF